MTERVGIVVDSTADFPPGMVEELGLHVVPIHIVIDGQDFRHGVTIENDRVIEDLDGGKLVGLDISQHHIVSCQLNDEVEFFVLQIRSVIRRSRNPKPLSMGSANSI